jgi:hypothetical protein
LGKFKTIIKTLNRLKIGLKRFKTRGLVNSI